MPWYQRQPTLDDILSDCITQAVMRADGVDPAGLAAMLREIGRGAGVVSRRRPAFGRWLRVCATSLFMLPAMACPVSSDDDPVDLSADAVIDRPIADGQTADPPAQDKA